MDITELALHPIPTSDAAALRRIGGPIHVADQHPGYPCRQCLRDAEVGDRLILVSHDPFTRDTPYRSASPIFLHATSCEPILGGDELPPQLTSRQLSVRAFDAAEMMIDAAIVDGGHLADTAQRLLDAPAADKLHVHNASRGCWAVTITRSADAGEGQPL